jgi:hypothetical protein
MGEAIPIISAIVGALATKAMNGSSSTPADGTSAATDKAMQEAIKAMMARQKSQDPLFNALTQLGTNLLPKSAYGQYPERTYTDTEGNALTMPPRVDPNSPYYHKPGNDLPSPPAGSNPDYTPDPTDPNGLPGPTWPTVSAPAINPNTGFATYVRPNTVSRS